MNNIRAFTFQFIIVFSFEERNLDVINFFAVIVPNRRYCHFVDIKYKSKSAVMRKLQGVVGKYTEDNR